MSATAAQQSAASNPSKPHPWSIFDFVKLLAAGFFLIPVAQPLAQDDYTFVRWLTAFVCLYGAYRAFKRKRPVWGAIFIVPTLIFNPLYHVHLWREAWMGVDLGLSVMLIASLTQVL